MAELSKLLESVAASRRRAADVLARVAPGTIMAVATAAAAAAAPDGGGEAVAEVDEVLAEAEEAGLDVPEVVKLRAWRDAVSWNKRVGAVASYLLRTQNCRCGGKPMVFRLKDMCE